MYREEAFKDMKSNGRDFENIYMPLKPSGIGKIKICKKIWQRKINMLEMKSKILLYTTPTAKHGTLDSEYARRHI